MGTIKVSSTSNIKKVAGAISAFVKETTKGETVEIQAIGAAAVNQAVKSIAVAQGFLAPNGFTIVSTMAFETISIEGSERTAIKFIVKRGV